MRKMKHVMCALALLGVGAVYGVADKFVAAGWEFAGKDVDHVLARADAYDQTALDGCVLYLEAKGKDGLRLTSRNIIHQRAWQYDELAPLVPKYRELLAHKAFRHSFLNSYRAPTNRVAWTDDAMWAKVANNMRVEARFAKACGFRGLQMDPEDYHHQNQYVRCDKDTLPYAELAALARRRGRQVFEGVFAEFPDVTILSYWLLTMGNTYSACRDEKSLQAFLARSGVDLWVPFVEGIFDALPPTATLIDGCENAYNWRAESMQYLKAAIHTREVLGGLLSPENRDKYKLQLQMSFGTYLDGYSVITNGTWYMPPLEGSRVRRLAANLAQSTEAAGEFIWFWGEKRSWIGKDSWEAQLPGLNDLIYGLKNPHELGRRLRERMVRGELKALNDNVACLGTDPARVPKPYSSWQEIPKYKLRRGTFGCDLTMGHGDSSSLVAQNVERGCFTYSAHGHKPGAVFGLSFASKGEHVSVRIGWMREHRWDWSIQPLIVPITGAPDAQGWTVTDFSFAIPERADGFGIMFNVNQDPNEKCWYDDIAVIPAS